MIIQIINDSLLSQVSTGLTVINIGRIINHSSRSVHIRLVNDTNDSLSDVGLYLTGEDAYTVTQTWPKISFTDNANCGVYIISGLTDYVDLSDMSEWTVLDTMNQKEAVMLTSDMSSSEMTTIANQEYFDIRLRLIVPSGIEKDLDLYLNTTYLY